MNWLGSITNIRNHFYQIEAQKYLLQNIEKYKIPIKETEITKENLKYYELELKKIRGENE